MSTPTPYLAVGLRRERVICDELRRTQIVQYAGVSGDYSPLHTDEVQAVHAAHPSVMAHGMMIMAASGCVLTDWVGVERLTRFSARFSAPAWPGDRLTTTVTIEAMRHEPDGAHVEFRLSTTNQDGVEVMAGTATSHLDRCHAGDR
jgi:acyl dehydratase